MSQLKQTPRLAFEGENLTSWQNAILHKFPFMGHEAWIVEPPADDQWIDESNWDDSCHTVANPRPAGPRKWFWLPEWPNSYPDRNGVRELLALGYTMAHVKVFGLCANGEALDIMHAFHEFLVKEGFAPSAAFIGMSLGGLYSFRYAATYPQDVACIYADAPVCDLNFGETSSHKASIPIFQKAYGVEELADHPLSPVNNQKAMLEAAIPVLMVLGQDDQIVKPESNGELFAKRYAEAGGTIEVLRRPDFGHHPHGLQNPFKILRFILTYI